MPLFRTVARQIDNPDEPPKSVDTMLLIETSALVYPATAYIEARRRNGARVAAVNTKIEYLSLLALEGQD